MSQRRGRPARLSHQIVVDAALELLDEGGLEAVTMSGVAAAVDSSPMGLYRHVDGREALLEAMLEELLSQLEWALPEDVDWRDNLRTWMRGIRAHFLAHPRILTLMDFEAGGHISPAWLRAVGALISPLQAAGLTSGELTHALLWISRLTMGTVMQEIAAPVSDTTAVLGGLGRLDAEDALLWVELLPDFKQASDEGFFALVEDQAIRAIEQWRKSGITTAHQEGDANE